MAFLHSFAARDFLDSLVSLFAAFVLGALIGAERQYRQRGGGLRTHVLVSVGAATFVDIGMHLNGNPGATQVIAYVVSGVGFLGAGVILKQGNSVSGLNTAATLWCSAAVGACAGADLGCVDGFDQDEAESKRDERAVILRRLLASKCDTLEAFELADSLFNACPCLVECFRKEGGHILGVGSIRDCRTYSALARGVAV